MKTVFSLILLSITSSTVLAAPKPVPVCSYHVFADLNLPRAFAPHSVAPGEVEKLQQLTNIATGGPSFKVAIDRSPLLERTKRGQWKLQIYTHKPDRVSPDRLIFDASKWHSESETIQLDQKVEFASVNGACPPLAIVATANGRVWEDNIILISGISDSEAFGSALFSWVASGNMNLWRSHKDGFNGVVLDRSKLSEGDIDRLVQSAKNAIKAK